MCARKCEKEYRFFYIFNAITHQTVWSEGLSPRRRTKMPVVTQAEASTCGDTSTDNALLPSRTTIYKNLHTRPILTWFAS